MRRESGFTLLEVLVSITLIAVLVVVLSMALRSGINAYTRARNFNASFFPESALEGLLFRQLEAVVAPGRGDLSGFFFFEGEEDKISFVTTYGPQGVGRGGIWKVVYWLNESENRLYYAQRPLMKRQDARKDLPDRFYDLSKEELNRKGWLVASLKGVKGLYFSYRHVSSRGEEEPGKWPEEFRKRRALPVDVAISVDFGKKGQRDDSARRWTILPVGAI